MTRYPSDEPTQEHDFVVVVRPTQPMSLTYSIVYRPADSSWLLQQGIRTWIDEQSRWQLEELVEFRYWTCADLLKSLRTLVEGAEGYFVLDGADELQSVVDRITDR